MHYPIFKFSLKIASIGPIESSIAAHFILSPVTSIPRAIGPKISTVSLFYSFTKSTTIVATIWPNLNSWSILVICLSKLPKNTKSSRFILLPRAFKYFSLSISKYTYAYCLSIEPKAFKFWTIRPGKFTIPTSSKFITFRVTLDCLLRVRLLFHISNLAKIFDTTNIDCFNL